MTDAELEQHITDLGRLVEKAHAEGDRAAAQAYAARRAEAIRGRSPEQVERMERALGLSEPCYFVTQGDAARAALEQAGRR